MRRVPIQPWCPRLHGARSQLEDTMGICKVCGNDYEHAFDVVRGDQHSTYDCFECAIHDFAPVCDHCQCRIIGHGTSAGEKLFCCAHCARETGVSAMADHTEQAARPHHAPFI
jgi:hypothetical protein